MESAFACAFETNQFHSYNTRVTNGNDSGAGSLRQAIKDVLSGGTIVVNDSVKTIQLTMELSIPATKSFVLEGNGVTIQALLLYTNNDSVIYLRSSSTATIRRVHFSQTQPIFVLWNEGDLDLESCVFSNNVSQYSTIVSSGGTMSIKGSTFYENSGESSGVIRMEGGSVTFTGNLFYGNTSTGPYNCPIVIDYSGTITSGGYNVVDVPLGTDFGQSGWVGHSTDKVISNMPIAPASFKPLSGRGAQNVTAIPYRKPTRQPERYKLRQAGITLRCR